MRIQSVLWGSLLVGLYGCQPNVGTSEQAAPTENLSSASSVSAEAAVVEAASTVEATVSAVAEIAPVVSVVAEKSVTVAKTVASEKVETVATKTTPVLEKTAQAMAVVKSVAPAKIEALETKVTPATIAQPAIAQETVVSEADALVLAKKYNCLTCHAIDKKVVGPAWKDVALKYRGDATAQAHLVSKIATGGKGVWGSMAMPAHPQISEADRSTLAKFVLSLK